MLKIITKCKFTMIFVCEQFIKKDGESITGSTKK